MASPQDKQHALGQFATPPDLGDLLLAFCLRRPSDRLLDPSCGEGALLRLATGWQAWLAQRPSEIDPAALWGVEVDQEAAALAQAALPNSHILCQDFFTWQPDANATPFDAIIGNPPYTRAEWLSDKDKGLPISLSPHPLVSPARPDSPLSRRAGLHAYFFQYGTPLLREGGRFGFIIPNSWLDIAYGQGLKQFLLDHYKIIALLESNVERWFQTAKVHTCLIILERCSHPAERASHRVRLVSLRRPLAKLIPGDASRYDRLERLTTRLLATRDTETEDAAIRVLPQAELAAEARWGVALRAPAVYRQRQQANDLLPLKQWARVQRGYTTGANHFFYLDPATVKRWQIEADFRRPLLKSLRHAHQLRLGPADGDSELLWIESGTTLAGTAAARYLAWGEQKGFHLRRTCAGRSTWYTLPAPPQPHLLLAKGIWGRHFAPTVAPGLLADQQLYQLTLAPDIPLTAAAALLNSAWFALQLELHGRINFGEGVLWLAGYELSDLRLPDPRRLPAAQLDQLSHAFERLAARPVTTTREELAQPDRQALDAAVFAAMGFTAAEGTAVVTALLEKIEMRQTKARLGQK
jgi:hypothetical protein